MVVHGLGVSEMYRPEQENKIQNNKLKLLPANYKHSRQKQNSRHYPEFVITRANCSRPKQIAHGKSQNGGQRFLVSGRPSTWCNTTRSTRPGRFPAFFGNVVIMFCSKCGCRSCRVTPRTWTTADQKPLTTALAFAVIDLFLP